MRLGRFVFVLAALTALGGSLWYFGRGVAGAEDLPRYLEGVGAVAVLGDDTLLALRAEGATMERASRFPAVAAALEGRDDTLLVRAMRSESVGAIVVGAAPTHELSDDPLLGERLRAYDAIQALRCVFLTPRAAIYVPVDQFALEPMIASALGFVARAVLAGTPPPRVQSFPEPLRRIRNIEVLVMIEDAGTPRLWRSARGSSIARGLLTAATVARQRWVERETTMGGALDTLLPRLDVSVFALDEDGTLGVRSPIFIERAFRPGIGVAFEQRGSWHYLLPRATAERGNGSAVRAYDALLSDADLPSDALSRPDVRLYRAVARLLARSPGSDSRATSSDEIAEEGSSAGNRITNVVP